jgi:hypothetical protein
MTTMCKLLLFFTIIGSNCVLSQNNCFNYGCFKQIKSANVLDAVSKKHDQNIKQIRRELRNNDFLH